MYPTIHKVLNAVLFQAAWFSAIFWELGAAVIFVVAQAAHAIGYCLSKRELVLSVFLVVFGIVMDSILMGVGVFQFSPEQVAIVAPVVPVWLCVLWIGFVFTIFISLRWAFSKPALFIVLCAFGAPVSYLAGRAAEVIYFNDTSILIISGVWFVFAAVCVALFSKIEKRSERLEMLAPNGCSQ